MTLKPEDRAYQLVNGFRAAQVVGGAVRLGIPDHLATGPMSVDGLSMETKIEAGRLRRLLRGLVALGVVAEQNDGRFSNTEVGELFREGVPGTRRLMALMLIPESYRAWDHFMETLQTGVTGHSLAHGGTLWESLARDPDFAARFNAVMASNSEEVARFVATSGEFTHASVVIDVGGGKGALVAGVMLDHPRLRGIVYDVPAGLAETSEYLAARGVADRCAIVEGDFFKSVPAGDVYLLKDILHDWDDERAGAILAVCRAAMNPGARTMIVERVPPSHLSDDPVHLNFAMTDLQMMVQLGGRERTLEEYEPLFEGAGLKLDRFTPGGVYQLVEAVAV
ncbi:MAG: methyltransferase [Chloroflexi bacterium]|nr:MAG: methyltransferase [Chloroflexota bacterium]